jgi:hypothetical protein
MKTLAIVLLAPVLFLNLPQQARAQSSKKLQVVILESTADTQSYDVPARFSCVPMQLGPLCASRGAETVNTYTIRIKARVVSSGVGMWLTCQLLKKGDDKHCGKILPGTHQAELKGNEKVIVYAWANPIFKGDLSKATKLEFHVRARELDKDELADAKTQQP